MQADVKIFFAKKVSCGLVFSYFFRIFASRKIDNFMLTIKGKKKKFKLLIGCLVDSLTEKERKEFEDENNRRFKFVYATEKGIYVEWSDKQRGRYAYKHKEKNVTTYEKFIYEVSSSLYECPFGGNDSEELVTTLAAESYVDFEEWWLENVNAKEKVDPLMNCIRLAEHEGLI